MRETEVQNSAEGLYAHGRVRGINAFDHSSYSKISACRHYHSGNQIFSIGRVLWLPEQYMGCCCN